MTYNDVSAQLGAGGTFAGFRFATQAEVLGLWASAGWNGMVGDGTPPGSLWSVSNNGVFDVLAEFWGDTGCLSGGIAGCINPGDGFSRVMYDDGPGGSTTVALAADMHNVTDSINADFFVIANNTLADGTAEFSTAAALVLAVPEPATFALLAAGCVMLAGRRRRRRAD